MNVLNNLNKKSTLDGCVLTIGNFDGVHVGHRYILREAISKAKLLGAVPVVMTFEPHPYKFFNHDEKYYLLLPYEEKYDMIKEIGIETIVVTDFTSSFATLSPHEYARRILKELINPSTIIVGNNFTFGRMASGDVSLLKTFASEFGFNVNIVDPYIVDGRVVSSSKIREYLKYGQIEDAARFLGYKPYIKGTVVTGTHRGTNILGCPTANIETGWELIPQNGVYVVKAIVNNHGYDAVANIGLNPTFGGHELKIEVHILDFNKNIVGEYVKVEFIHKIRDEERFSSAEELKQKILNDIKTAKKIFSSEIGTSKTKVRV